MTIGTLAPGLSTAMLNVDYSRVCDTQGVQPGHTAHHGAMLHMHVHLTDSSEAMGEERVHRCKHDFSVLRRQSAWMSKNKKIVG